VKKFKILTNFAFIWLKMTYLLLKYRVLMKKVKKKPIVEQKRKIIFFTSKLGALTKIFQETFKIGLKIWNP